MGEEAQDLIGLDEASGADRYAPERGRERAVRGPAPEPWPETRPHEVRALRSATEAGGIVRVEVSAERMSRNTPPRPVVVVQVELPAADAPPESGNGVSRALRLERGSTELPSDEDGLDAGESAPRAAGWQAAARVAGWPESAPARTDVRLRGWKRIGSRLPITIGQHCPRCGKLTLREPTPWFVRPLRWLMLNRGSYRRCPVYHWKGLALHR